MTFFLKPFTISGDLSSPGPSYPHYLLDSDTYIDIDALTKFLFGNPYRVPSYDEPVIWAACKMNFGNPEQNNAFTTPYGGFGTVFSQRSLRLMNMPLYCLKSLVPSAHERTICNKYTKKANFSYPGSTTIGEEHFFSPGDSITDVFRKYLQNPHGCQPPWGSGWLTPVRVLQ